MHDDEAEEIENFEAIVAELARLRALNAELVGALEATAAWFYSEHNHSTATFHERMELCRYCEWKAEKALGSASTGDYNGVPSLRLDFTINPYIHKPDEAEAQAIVDRVLAIARAKESRE